MAYRITRLADEDLVSIARYTTQQWGEAQCRTYIEELFTLFERVGHTPLTSPAADYIQPGLRKQSHPKRLHVVYFRIGDDGIVEILRVLHAHQNRDSAFECVRITGWPSFASGGVRFLQSITASHSS